MSGLKKLVLSQTTARETEKKEAPCPRQEVKPAFKLGTPKPSPAPEAEPKQPDTTSPKKGLVLGTPKPAPKEEKPFAPANKLAVPALSANESPASAPARDYPAELDAQQLTFVADLDSLYTVFDDISLVSQAIRNLIAEMRENPNYVDLVMDDDRHTMMRALKETLGLAQVKKAAKKRAAPKKSAAKTTKALSNLGGEAKDALDDAFSGLGI